METYNRLRLKPLSGSRKYLAKAKRDAEYVNRLVKWGADTLICELILIFSGSPFWMITL